MGNKTTNTEELSPFLKGRLGKVNHICKLANDAEAGNRLNFHRSCVQLLSSECLSKHNEFSQCLAQNVENFYDEKQITDGVDNNGTRQN